MLNSSETTLLRSIGLGVMATPPPSTCRRIAVRSRPSGTGRPSDGARLKPCLSSATLPALGAMDHLRFAFYAPHAHRNRPQHTSPAEDETGLRRARIP